MFRHVVTFRWRPEATEADERALTEALARLPGEIDTIRAYHFGPDAGLAETNFDYAVVGDFDDEAGYLVYRDHPAHRAVIEAHIVPNVSERAAVQHELG